MFMIAPTERPSYLMRMDAATMAARNLYNITGRVIGRTNDPETVNELRTLHGQIEEIELAIRTAGLEADRAYKMYWGGDVP